MLERVDRAGRIVRPAGFVDALRERTRALHTEAERSGLVAEILRGRGTKFGYALMLRNLLPVYAAMENALVQNSASRALALIVRPALFRAGAISADLAVLSPRAAELPLLPQATAYVNAIAAASTATGDRLIAHAYTRYLGDLSGGQILKRLLARSLTLPSEALTVYDFPDIADIAAFKDDYRDAIERAGAMIGDPEAVLAEAAGAFRLNIDLSIALQAMAS
jgi:heme oxygenase